MNIRHFKPSDYQVMPWLNGQGQTLEIDRDQEDYHWRLSIATVKGQGDFSKFEAKQRIISMLKGDSIELSFNQMKTVKLGLFEACAFSGDDETRYQVIGSDAEDFNLIYQPEQCRARLAWHHFLGCSQLFTTAQNIFIFNPLPEPITVQISELNYNIQAYELLKISEVQSLVEIRLLSDQPTFFCLIEISENNDDKNRR